VAKEQLLNPLATEDLAEKQAQIREKLKLINVRLALKSSDGGG
jgi:hypothetical protein